MKTVSEARPRVCGTSSWMTNRGDMELLVLPRRRLLLLLLSRDSSDERRFLRRPRDLGICYSITDLP